MFATELIALALMHLGPTCTQAEARALAPAIVWTSQRHAVAADLLAAVVLVETAGSCRLDAFRRERLGCSVGPFQIYCPGCRRSCVRHHSGRSGLRHAANRAGRILELGRRLCAGGSRRWYCRRGQWFARFNPGSRRWASAVDATRWRVRASRARLLASTSWAPLDPGAARRDLPPP